MTHALKLLRRVAAVERPEVPYRTVVRAGWLLSRLLGQEEAEGWELYRLLVGKANGQDFFMAGTGCGFAFAHMSAPEGRAHNERMQHWRALRERYRSS